jgi:predicted nucleotidyltransferase
MTKLEFPPLTNEKLSRIISDAAEMCAGVQAVGIVGSFARGEQSRYSDVDLIVKGQGSEIFEFFGEYVRKILDYQFGKSLDIVRYDFATERAGRDPAPTEAWYYREGFAQMLREVKWQYEKRPTADCKN